MPARASRPDTWRPRRLPEGAACVGRGARLRVAPPPWFPLPQPAPRALPHGEGCPGGLPRLGLWSRRGLLNQKFPSGGPVTEPRVANSRLSPRPSAVPSAWAEVPLAPLSAAQSAAQTSCPRGRSLGWAHSRTSGAHPPPQPSVPPAALAADGNRPLERSGAGRMARARTGAQVRARRGRGAVGTLGASGAGGAGGAGPGARGQRGRGAAPRAGPAPPEGAFLGAGLGSRAAQQLARASSTLTASRVARPAPVAPGTRRAASSPWTPSACPAATTTSSSRPTLSVAWARAPAPVRVRSVQAPGQVGWARGGGAGAGRGGGRAGGRAGVRGGRAGLLERLPPR